tara:strand:+ start:229 stop:648 length:420 start_codon:yes stop_codon:yes gene_type:complete
MLFSFLIASVSAGPTSTTGIVPSPSPSPSPSLSPSLSKSPSPSPIINRCGVNGVVPHSYIVTLESPPHSNGRRLDTQKDKLSFLQGWFHLYNPEDTSNGTKRRKLKATTLHDNSTHAVHYFTETQLAVAIEGDDEVRPC